jgi:hypothetical protein
MMSVTNPPALVDEKIVYMADLAVGRLNVETDYPTALVKHGPNPATSWLTPSRTADPNCGDSDACADVSTRAVADGSPGFPERPLGVRGRPVRWLGGVQRGPSACVILSRNRSGNQRVGRRSGFGERHAAQIVEELTEEQYDSAIELNAAKDQHQRSNLRVLAWRRRNDAVRNALRLRSVTMLDGMLISRAMGEMHGTLK